MFSVAVLFCLATGCAAAMVGAPPARVDVGSVTTARQGVMSHGVRGSAGIHWASATTSHNVPFDIGAGAVYERFYPDAALLEPVAEKSAMEELNPPVERYGGYLEGSWRLSGKGSQRAWIGGRAEMMGTSSGKPTSLSLVGRVSWELYGNGTAAAAETKLDKGLAMFASTGTIGLGAYLESGLRHSMDGDDELIVTAGLSVRVPAFLFLFVGWR